jgi:hypothetical protein
MVTRDVSHPCILFWDNGNEGGWNTELDDEFALYDPQNRTVLHPWAKFNNIDTDHYETYDSVINKLRSSTLFMPTELLHGLYDGGLGAGLNDYWKIMYPSPMGAGLFLWALVDEGVKRVDRAGEIDVAGNKAPDGIVGPYREKEGSFYTVKEIFSPVHIPNEKLPEDFNGKIEIENRYDFINLKDCTFEVKLGRFPIPQPWAVETAITYSGVFKGPDIEPHNTGTITLPLPENLTNAEVLFLTATDPSGEEIWTWSWDMKDIEHYPPKIFLAKETLSSNVTATSSDDEITVTTDQAVLRFSNVSGELLGVTVDGDKINFGSGPKLLNGITEYTKRKVGWTYAKDSVLIRTEYQQEMNYINWIIHPTGWVELEYEFELEGEFELLGVNFDYPESKVEQMRWVGKGPYRVWKNRIKGGQFGLWNNNYKNHVPGVTWDFPEFKGYYRDWRWVEFKTIEGTITIANGTDDLYLGVYRPNDGPEPLNTGLNVPDTGIALLNGISPIGTKFLQAHQLGPEGRLNNASGKYSGHVYFYFDN